MQQQIRSVLLGPVALATVAAVLGAFGLSACGGSSGSSTTNAGAAATASSHNGVGTTSGTATSPTTTPRGGTGSTGSTSPRLTALRECLQRNGVKLPAQPGGGGGIFRNLPSGVSRAKMQATVSKCLGGGNGRFLRRPGAGALRYHNPAFNKALASFASCLRQNGVNVPQPNTSSRGPVFSTKGIDTASPKFREATKKCRGVLAAAFAGRR